MLPAEERYNLTFEPPRPPGPSAGRLAFAGAPQPPAAAPSRRASSRCATTSTASSCFAMPAICTAIFDAARARNARRIAITGYRGTVLLSNGTTLTEQASLPRRRAEQIESLLRGAGLTDVDLRRRMARRAGAAGRTSSNRAPTFSGSTARV